MESPKKLLPVDGEKPEGSVQVISELISDLKIDPTETETNETSGMIVVEDDDNGDNDDMNGSESKCLTDKPEETDKCENGQQNVTCPQCDNHPLMKALIKMHNNFPFTSENYTHDAALYYQAQSLNILSKLIEKYGCLSCNCFIRLDSVYPNSGDK